MASVESSVVIGATVDKVFAVSQDYHIRLKWDPFLRKLKFLNGVTEPAVGVQVFVTAKNGLSMEVEYITFEPPHLVAVKMVKGPRFFKYFAGTWRFVRSSAGETTVHFRYSFTTRWRFLQFLLDPAIRLVFRRDIRARLRGLKRFAEAAALPGSDTP